MPGRRKELLLIISLLLADFALIGQASGDAAVQSPFQESTNGHILLGGGYFDQENTAALLKRMIDLAGGASTSLVIIPTADSRLEPRRVKKLIRVFANVLKGRDLQLEGPYPS